MFRKWLSGFYRRNKEKIELLAKVMFITLIIVFIFYLLVKNSINRLGDNTYEPQTVYKPQQTVISGSNIKEEKYKEDTNIVETFVEYCNNGKVNEAYNLLTDECKENLYQTVEDFKLKYCDRYFSEKKTYNLQSWINNGDYTTYKMRINEDVLSKGEYKDGETYEDYITIVSNGENKKINTNGYIYRKEINQETHSEEININVNKVDVYMNYEEYTLEVTNNTENIIMLDNMQNSEYTLRLSLSNGKSYPVLKNSINYMKLIVNPEESKNIKIQFNKAYSSSLSSEYILFSKIVKNYNEFITNQTEYSDYTNMKAKTN